MSQQRLTPDHHEFLSNILDREILNFSQQSDDSVVKKQESKSDLNYELSSLHDKIRSLEAKLRINNCETKKQVVRKAPVVKQKKKRLSGRSIRNTEKQLQQLEKSLNSTPRSKRSPSVTKDLDLIRRELTKERFKVKKLTKENQQLQKLIQGKEKIQSQLILLQDEYNSLSQAFDRSEKIRKKQRELIKQLKTKFGKRLRIISKH